MSKRDSKFFRAKAKKKEEKQKELKEK